MASNPNKRSADADIEFIRARKRPAPPPNTNPKPPGMDPEEDAFQITIKIHKRFDRFPAKLRTALENLYQTSLRLQMTVSSNEVPTKLKYTYSVVRGTCNRFSTEGFNYEFIRNRIASSMQANIDLLERLKVRIEPNSKVTFVELKTREGVVNPPFSLLHSVRSGELGWGIDAADCLSFCFTRIDETKVEETKLKDMVWFVERKEAKVKDEE